MKTIITNFVYGYILPVLLFLMLFLAMAVLAGCQASITVKFIDPDTDWLTVVEYKSMRKALIEVDKNGVMVVTGEVAIDQETARVLIRETASAIDGG